MTSEAAMMPHLRPVAAVSVAVLRGRDVLLVQRGKPPYGGVWSLPGGSIQLGEIAEDAARRELLEETGLLALALTLGDVVDAVVRDKNGTVVAHYVIAVFCTREVSGSLLAGTDAADARWFAPGARSGIALTPGLETVIAKAGLVLGENGKRR
jgi:8-oxo-dGTP diphosphatase